MSFDVAAVRAQFPALSREDGGRSAVYFDGPGGSQSPESVIEAMGDHLRRGTSNLGGPFATSHDVGRITAAARNAVADLVGGRSDEIVFGQNMTSLTFSISRSLALTWRIGDNVVVTRLDHDANVTPWVMAAADAGVEVRRVDFDPATCRLDMDSLESALDERTRLVAVGYASNAVGTINDVAAISRMAHEFGALVYVDAVHFAPHGFIAVGDLDCDFLAASAYKFFGPHQGFVWGRHELLEEVTAYKVRPAPDTAPDKFETGTQSFESLAGTTAAIDYIASHGSGGARREQIRDAFDAIGGHEHALARRFLDGLAETPGLRLFGVPSPDGRTPTFAVAVDGVPPADVARRLGEHGIYVWSGHYYAVEVMDRLGVLDSGGLVRIGFLHYNTAAEVDRVLVALEEIAAQS